MPLLKRVQAGISRVRMTAGRRSHTRLPITAAVLAQIRTALDTPSQPNRTVLWAVSALTFFGFFRLGELLLETTQSFGLHTHLAWGDIAVDDRANPSMVRVLLKRSKCDQFGRGVHVFVGRTNTPLCPVAATLNYMASRGDKKGPFFLNSEQHVVTKAWFISQLRAVFKTIGLPEQSYAGHSFRIGAATMAALAGVEDSTIQALGRWHSAAFLQYIRMPKEQLASLSTVMAAQAP